MLGWFDDAIRQFCGYFPESTFFSLGFNVRGLLAVILVSLICGAVGSLVVGNRMAFFSDALAHCAFAGVGLGLLIGLLTEAAKEGPFYRWGLPVLMVGFGILVGAGIAFVREKTALANDTVIGVFFAGAMGLGAVLLKHLSKQTYFNPENFLFGDLMTVNSEDLVLLLVLGIITAGVLAWMYNRLVFTSFNTSLARSRQIPVRACNYLFIVLLALIVNLCLKIVGALLINALLIVPAATAGNLCRNMRQLFWATIGLCLFVGVGGQWLSWDLRIAGGGGSIVVLSVFLFFLSMLASPWVRGRQPV